MPPGDFVYIAGSDWLLEVLEETDARRTTIQLVTFLGGIDAMGLLTAVGCAATTRQSSSASTSSGRR